MSLPTSKRIAALNDEFRKRGPLGARSNSWLITQGVAALDPSLQIEVLRAVLGFTAFTADNDPHGEHDFGALMVAGTRLFWKIDYYDLDLQFASPDAADPNVTRRVLTVMLADEY